MDVPGGARAGIAWLAPSQPNPARGGGAWIRYGLPTAERASLVVYDVSGRKVRTPGAFEATRRLVLVP